MSTRKGAWFLAVPVVVIVACLSVESLPPGEPATIARYTGRTSALAPFLRFARLGQDHAKPAVTLKIAPTNVGPLVPITVSTLLPDARTFCVDVDLNHDGRFEGAGELSYATGNFDEAGIGDLRLHGLIDGRYRARVRVDGIHGEVTSSIQKFELSPPRNSHLPISFEVNRGQTDSSVLFLGRAKNQMVYVTRDETVLVTTTRRAELRKEPVDKLPATQFATRFRLAGASSWAKPTGQKMLPGKANYFIGNNPDKWRTDIDTFAEITTDAYPGIRMIHRSSQGRLAYDFRIAPGANPADITLDFSDAERLSLNDDGDLIVHHPRGETIRHSAPVMYQEHRGNKQAIKGDWVLKGKQAAFVVAAYDRGRELVIDPVSYATFLGGSTEDIANGIGVDGAGNAYVAGVTNSPDFPKQGAYQPTFNGGSNDMFVTKINDNGTALVYSTYLGGSDFEGGGDWGGIAVNDAGNAFVTGTTRSSDFPTKNAQQAGFGGGTEDVFVTKLNLTGSALDFSTYFGGSNNDRGFGIAVDASDAVYVVGLTNSGNLPTTAGAFQTIYMMGPSDGFVVKYTATGTLAWATYLGGDGDDRAYGVAVNGTSVFVTGETSGGSFPVQGPFQPAYGTGISDAFVTALKLDGTAPVYSSFLGGDSLDKGYGIAVDAPGNAYVGGRTDSNNFPVTPGAMQGGSGGGLSQGFVTKVDPSGSARAYSTYLGGDLGDAVIGIAIDSIGNVYVTGSTSGGKFPQSNSFQTFGGGTADAFATVINSSGTALILSTFLGGLNDDFGVGITVNAANCVYVAGVCPGGFPVTTGAFQTTFQGGPSDGFVMKLFLPGPPPLPGPGVLYGITLNSNQLITIDPATAAGTLVGPLSTGMNAFGIAFRGNQLYGWDDVGNRLRELNPATGATVNTINIGAIPGPGGEGDIVYRNDGIGFIAVQPFGGELWQFDQTVPSSSKVGLLNPTMDGLAFDPLSGVLYGLANGGGSLYTINTATGLAILVGNTAITGFPINTSGGLAFDNSGNLYAALSAFPPGPSSLFRINKATGAATLIGNIGFNGISGIRFLPPPLPTPGGGIDEGSYAGSKGPSNGFGGEGTFGFGRNLKMQHPRLKGPYRDPAGTFRVFNVAHQQRGPATDADSGLGVLGWGLMLLAVFVPAAVVYGRRR